MPRKISNPDLGAAGIERASFFGSGLSGTNLECGSSHNLRVTLQAIRLNAPNTKVELAEITGLTAQSITNISRKLRDDDLIIDAGRRRGERGQPAMRLAINPDAAFSIGVNIDRDHVTLVALDFQGRMRFRSVEHVAFPMPRQVTDFVGRCLDAIGRSGDVDMKRIVGIGIAMPDDFGKVDLPNRPPEFGTWESVDLAQLLSGFGYEVIVENDASAAAVGELQFGHGRGEQTFFYLLVSAGLGGGLIIDGQPVAGASGRSGEIGFLPIGNSRRNSSNLQDFLSLSGLKTHLAESGFTDIEIAKLGDAEMPARDCAAEWAGNCAELLSDPLLVINAALNPGAIFIGGQLPTELVDILSEKLNLQMRRKGVSLPALAPVRRAALAEDAAAMGAAILPFASRFLPSRAALLKADA